MADEEKIMYSIQLRLWHLFHLLLFIFQVVTGFYMYFGENERFFKFHRIGGALFLLSFIYYIVLILPRESANYFPIKAKRLELLKTLRFYLHGIFVGEKLEYSGRIDPVRKIIYAFINFLLLPLLILSGFYSRIDEWRGIHVLLAYILVSFILIHIYLGSILGARRIVGIFLGKMPKNKKNPTYKGE